MKTILLFCGCVSPTKGSEYAVAWNYITQMSTQHKLIVLYPRSGDEYGDFTEMRHFLQQENLPNVKFIEIALPKKMTGKNHLTHYFDYKNLHKEALILVLKLQLEKEIDLIHYLNPIGFKEPGFLWKINKPYIWGPITAVHNWPLALFPTLSLKDKIGALTRRFIHNSWFRFPSRVQKAFHRSDVVIAATPKTKALLKDIHHIESYYLPENGILQMEVTKPISFDNKYPLELIWVGAIVPGKGLQVLLDSLSIVKRDWRLHIVGDGELTLKLKKYAKEIKVDSKITWHGRVSRIKVQELFMKAHLHVITSLSEATTTVLFEAMAKGIPTITLDHCGMKGVICEKCGIKIPIINYTKVKKDIASSLEDIINNPHKINFLSKGVIECGNQFSWENRKTFFNKMYVEAIKNFENNK